MKKLYIILTVVLALGVTTSCVKPFEHTTSLAINGIVRDLPTAHNSKELIEYVQVVSDGSWIAMIEQPTSGEATLINFWLETSYVKNGKTVQINNLKPLAYYQIDGVDSELLCKVKGTGSTFVPIRYVETTSTRYATFTVYRPDTGERCSIRLDQ